MASNSSTLPDEDGDFSDWIEISNPSNESIDLGGYHLTDDIDDPQKWTFPRINLRANSRIIIFASGKDRTNPLSPLHTDFELNAKGEYLALASKDGKTVLTEFSPIFPTQTEDQSFGTSSFTSNIPEYFISNTNSQDEVSYLVPSSEVELPSDWNKLEPQFDINSWPTGINGLGWESNNGTLQDLVQTEIRDQMRGINSSGFFRFTFNFDPQDRQLKTLILKTRIDDGYIAYINGKEIAFGNKPSSPAWNSDASTDHPDSQATSFVDTDLSVQASEILREGNNLLAIHSMNGDTRSSDLLALPRLEAQFIIEADEGGEQAPPELGYFQAPTPNKNNGSDSGLPSSEVIISQPGRGFTGSLSVSLSSESAEAEIRYTTNGSLPTEVSSLYTGAIPIQNSTLLRARSFEEGLTAGPVSEAGYIRLSSDAQNFSSNLPVVIMERFSNGGTTAANGKTFTFFAFFEPDPQTGQTRLDRPYSCLLYTSPSPRD